MSGSTRGNEIDIQTVHGGDEDGGVAHGALLNAFTEAVMGGDDAALEAARKALRAVLSDEAFVDTCATIGSDSVMDLGLAVVGLFQASGYSLQYDPPVLRAGATLPGTLGR